MKLSRSILSTVALTLLLSVAAFAQATTRTVTGTIRKPTGAVWVGAKVKFTLTKGSFSTAAQFPVSVVEVTTGSDGTFTTPLWVTSEALKFTRYECTLPDGDTFRFDLVAGASIDIATLRAASGSAPTPADPAYATMQAQIAAHEAAANPHPVYLTEDEGDALYAPLSHTHAIADTTGLQAALDAKALSSDLTTETTTRGAADTTLQANIDAEASARASAISSASTADRARSNHTGTQALSTISDAGTAASRNVAASGNASSGEVVKGDDTRLTDSRTPTAHASTHAAAGSDPVTISESQVANLVSDLAAKATVAALTTHTSDTSNPHAVTKAQVGLGSVTNDAQLKIASNLSDVADAATARANIGAGTGNGSVTSVGLTVPGVIFSVSGSPVTSSGTLAFSLLNQTANTVFAGGAAGGAAAPSFRALVAADIPSLTASKISDFNSSVDARISYPVTLAGAESLTNKTLTSPKIVTSLLDTNGNTLLGVTATASAVNYLNVANAASGNSPVLSAAGSGTNIDIVLAPKGSGAVKFGTDNTYDIGASGANRPKNIYAAGTVSANIASAVRLVTADKLWLGASPNSVFSAQTSGVVTFTDGAETGFSRINWGPGTASFPALKRVNKFLAFRLADDSAASIVATGQSANTDMAGQLTLVAGTASFSFTLTYVSAPICTASDTTAANAVQVVATTTTLTVNGTGTDVINYTCVARN